MSINALSKPLTRLALFSGLKPLQITEIVRCAARVVYKPGDTILEEDAAGNAAIVIIEGEAVRHSGPPAGAPSEIVGPGSMLGEMAMLVETVHSSTIVARTVVKALRITRAELHDIMLQDPSIADHFAQKITARLSGLATELRYLDGILGARDLPAIPAPAPQQNAAAVQAVH